MKRYFASFAAIAIPLFFFVSCYYDNEEALYPEFNPECDTITVTYSGTIQPMLANNCLTCHNNAATGGSILLNSYGQVVAYAPRITGAIKHQGSFSPMPKDSPKLKDCLIAQWDIWVNKGMLND
jgi:hypothetical protein